MIAPLGRPRVRPRHASPSVWRTGRRSEAVPAEAAPTDLAAPTRELKRGGHAADAIGTRGVVVRGISEQAKVSYLVSGVRTFDSASGP